ncbi:MAG: CARDB domain-containing protein, partial [Nanoarchaeota archaeon]
MDRQTLEGKRGRGKQGKSLFSAGALLLLLLLLSLLMAGLALAATRKPIVHPITLPPQVQVLFPNNGENITTRTLNVSWNAFDPDGDVVTLNIFVDRNSDPADGSIQVASSEPNDGWYILDLLPLALPEDYYYIRVDAVADIERVTDYADLPFYKGGFAVNYSSGQYQASVLLVQQPEITVSPDLAPLGRGIYPIRFTVRDPNHESLFGTFYYSSSPGQRQNLISQNIPLSNICTDPDGDTATANNCTLYWNTTLNANVSIDIVATNTHLEGNASTPLVQFDNNPEVQVLFPNGGEELTDRYVTASWTAGDVANFSVLIDLYYDDDATAFNGRTLIASAEPNDGFYVWDLHTVQAGDYYLSIDARSSGVDSSGNPITVSSTDYSNALFRKRGFNESFTSVFVSNNYTVTVNEAPAVEVTSPNGGETINGTQSVQFNVSDLQGDFLAASIYYSTVPGAKENLIGANISLNSTYCADPDGTTSTENSCAYSWDTLGLNGNYYLDILVSDSILTGFDSSDASFTVNNYPRIMNLTVSNVTDQSSLISWQTPDEDTNATVRYGLDQNLTQQTSTLSVGRIQVILLQNLVGNKVYYFSALSCDATGLCTSSSIRNFTTLDNRPALAVLSPNGGEVFTTSQVNITWNATDPDQDPITLDVYYDTDNLSVNGRNLISSGEVNDGWLVWNIQNLNNGNYFVSIDANTTSLTEGPVIVQDYSDNSFEKSDISLVYTSNAYQADVLKNAPVSIVIGVNDTEPLEDNVTISFNLTDLEDQFLTVSLFYSSAPGLKEYALFTDLIINASFCAVVQQHSQGGASYGCEVVIDSDSINGDFYLDLEADDSIHTSLNSSSLLAFNNPPHFMNIQVLDIDTHTVQVSWQTAELTNASISYGLSQNYTDRAADSNPLLNQSLVLANLTGNRRYHFMITSCDTSGKCTSTQDMNFTTLNNLPIVQVIYPNGGEQIDQQVLNIQWSAVDEDLDPATLDIFYDVDANTANGRFLIAANQQNNGSYTWDLSGLQPGPYYISIDAKSQDLRQGQVTVTDYSDGRFTKGQFGNTFTSNSYNVTVFKNTNPFGNITSPTLFSILVRNTTINFTVHDNEGDGLYASIYYGGEIFRRQLIVTNPRNTPLISYPVSAVIDTKTLIEQHKLRPDAVELKIIVDGIEEQLFIESGLNTNATVVWFSVSLQPGQTRNDIYLLYGAAASLAMERSEPDWTRFLPSLNVLANKPILSFSSEAVGFPAANSNDNNTATKWRGTGSSDFIRYNLTGLHNPSMVKFTAGSGTNHSRARFSLDNANFTVINETTFWTGTVQNISFRPIEMRYLLIDQITSTTQSDIFEIELFTPLLIQAAIGAESAGSKVPIVLGLDLSNPATCTDPDGSTTTPNNCSYFWDMSQLDGEFCIRLETTDLISETAVHEVCNITIDNINDYPLLVIPVLNQRWEVNTELINAFDLDDYFRDPNNDTLTFNVTGNSIITVGIDPFTHLVSFSQPQNFTGKEFVTFIADDGYRGITASNLVELFVTPTKPNISGLPDQFLLEDSPIGFSVDLWNYSSDQEMNLSQLSYAVVSQTNASLINCVITGGHFATCLAPRANASGESIVNVSVSDSTSFDYDYFSITVIEINDAPDIANLPDKTILEDQDPPDNWIDLWNYTQDVEDPDSSLAFTITSQTNTGLISCDIASNRFVNCSSPSPTQSGFSDVSVQATDTGNLTDADTFRVTVIPVDNMPVITLLEPVNGYSTIDFTLNFSYTVTDIDDTWFLCDLIIDSIVQVNDRNVSNGTVALETVSNLSAGMHTWRARCTDRSNTALSENRSFSIFTDLEITTADITFSDELPLQGDTINITAIVRNLGRVDALNVPVAFFLNTIRFSTQLVSIPQNNSRSITIPFNTGPFTGNNTILVKVNENATIQETNLDNNNASKALFITQDIFPPAYDGLVQLPANITEQTGSVNISVNVTDRGSGVNPTTVRLIYTLGIGVPQVVGMSTENNRRYTAVFSPDFNSNQGQNFTYYITAQDNRANTNRTEDFIDYIDPINDPPAVTIARPDNQTSFNLQGQVIWNVFDEDNDPTISSLYYRTRASSSLTSAAGSYMFITTTAINETTFLWNTSGISQGHYQLKINASDGAAQGEQESAIFTIDHTPPAGVTLVSPINGTTTNQEPVQFRFNTSDNLAATLACDLFIDGFMGVVNISAQNSTQKVQNVPGIPEGAHSWSVVCRDLAGLSAASLTEQFSVDRTRPTIMLQEPVPAAVFSQPNIIFNFTATDNVDSLLDCALLINGGQKGSITALNNTFTSIMATSLNSQVHNWQVRCTDEAANGNTTESRILNIQTDLSIASSDITFSPETPTQGTSTTANATIRNLGIANASSVLVEFYDQFNVLKGSRTVNVPALGSATASITWSLAGYSPGEHPLQAIIQQGPYLDSNLANNEAGKNITIILDQDAPVFSQILTTPRNITEHTLSASFDVNITDTGVGIDPSSVLLNYSVGAISGSKAMTLVSGNTYRAVLNRSDIDFDALQGNTLSFLAAARDLNGNAGTSLLQQEYIDPVNDAPNITIFLPDASSQWGGVQTILFNVDND